MTNTFTLSINQIKAAKRHGLEAEVTGPVEGTKDIYRVSVEPGKMQALITSVFRWGKEEGQAMGRCKVITMYPSYKRRIA